MGALPIIGSVVGAVGTISQIAQQKKQAEAQKYALSKQQELAEKQYELNKQAIEEQKKLVLDEQKANQQQVELLKDQANYRRNYDNQLANQQQMAALNQAAMNYEQKAMQAQQATIALDQAAFQADQKKTLGIFQTENQAKATKANANYQAGMGKVQADSEATARTGAAKGREQAVRGATYGEERGLNIQARQELLQFGRVLDEQERQSKMGQASGAARTGTNTRDTASGQAAGDQAQQGQVDAYQENVDPVQDEMQAAALQGQMQRRTAALERKFAIDDAQDSRDLTRKSLEAQRLYQVGDAEAQRKLARSTLTYEGLLSQGSIGAQRKASQLGLNAALTERDLGSQNVKLGGQANKLGRSAEYQSELDLLDLQRRQMDVVAAAKSGSLTRSSQAALLSSQAEQASLGFQRSQVQSPGLLSLASAGLNIYNDLRGAGVFGRPSYQPPVYQQPGAPPIYNTGSSGLMGLNYGNNFDPGTQGATFNQYGDFVPTQPAVMSPGGLF